MASIWDPAAGGETVNANSTLKRQRFTASANQTDFTLTEFSYIPGTGSTIVFYNGSAQQVPVDYTELSSSVIRTNFSCSAGDIVDVIGFTGVSALVENIRLFNNRVVATAGQTEIPTAATYRAGTSSTAVYKDGLRLVPGVDYTETDNTSYVIVTTPAVGGETYFTVVGQLINDIGSDAALISYLPEGSNAAATNLQDFLRMIVRVTNFGADRTGEISSVDAFEAAVAEAGRLSNLYAKTGGILKVTAQPAVTVLFPPGAYFFDREAICGVRRIKLVGDNALIWTKTNGVIPTGYLIRFTEAFDTLVQGITFGSTETGCINFDCPNRSGAMVDVKACQFIGNSSNTGTAIRHNNTSCILNVEGNLFIQIKHPFDHASGDKVTFRKNWFDITGTLTYEDDSGYFNNVRGIFTLEDNLFAGGPADKGVRTAYFNCTNDIELRIRNNRIGFEGGGGTIVNWKVPLKAGGGAFHRTGFTIENTDLSPRDANVPFGDSRVATPVVRLYEMPNKMIFKDLAFRNTIQGIIAAAPTTTLDALIAQVATFENTVPNNKSATRCVYEYIGNIGDETYLVTESDSVKYQRWLRLFNVFDWNFEPQATGNQSTYIWDTFFTGSYLNSSLWEISARFRNAGGTGGQEYPRRWLLSTITDPTALTRSFVLTNLDAVGAVDAKNITLIPKFVDYATLTETDTISNTANLADYFIRMKATPTGTLTFSCTSFYMIPINGRDKSTGTAGRARQATAA